MFTQIVFAAVALVGSSQAQYDYPYQNQYQTQYQTQSYPYQTRGYPRGYYQPQSYYGSSSVSLQMCLTNLQVLKADQDNMADFEEEWYMEVGLIGAGTSPIYSKEINVPTAINGQSQTFTVGDCQTYSLDQSQLQGLEVYVGGYEKDSPPFNPNDILPSNSSVINLTNMYSRQLLQIFAADDKHAYIAHISLKPLNQW
jgi:hypothetical protein